MSDAGSSRRAARDGHLPVPGARRTICDPRTMIRCDSDAVASTTAERSRAIRHGD